MIANAQQRKKTFKTNIFKCFLERASISNFCCAINQNNPRKSVSYDRLHLLQPCGKFLSWASPIPLGNFYPLARPPPPPLGISINHPWGGGGMDIFWNHTILPFSYNGYLYKMPLFVVSFEFCQTFDVFCPKILSWFSFNLSWFSFNCWHKCIVSDGGCSLPFLHWSGLKRYPQFDMVALPRLQ